ncbi:MAG: hypothetical protein H7249_02100 [Chitinophagaceae bacterium]|nr:hypothetical protein [Oligoflexus sp.]
MTAKLSLLSFTGICLGLLTNHCAEAPAPYVKGTQAAAGASNSTNGGPSTSATSSAGTTGATGQANTVGASTGNPSTVTVPEGKPIAVGSGNPSSTYGLGRGAKVPWIEFQAENGITNAAIIGPSRERYDANHIEAEAIGRKAVRLDKTGDYVAFKATQVANSLVVRLSIPDSSGGGGIDSTIGVYVAGKRVKSLPVTSRYSWVYGGEALATPNEPGQGQPHTFFDEARTLLTEFPAGTEIKLQKDAEDNAAFYVIDLIDLEEVAPPLTKPEGLVSIVDFGAKPDDNIDDAVAIQNAINSVIDKKGKGIWIPAGKFIVTTLLDDKGFSLNVSGMEFRGAGMWYSTLTGKKPTLSCVNAGGCKFSDFAISGEVDRRTDSIPTNGFDGSVGKGTTIENVWVEHMKVGFWCGSDGAGSATPPKDRSQTDGLVVRNSRFRNLYADGVNLDNGTVNSLIEHNHFRNTGDDSIAIWSYKGAMDDPDEGNIARNNTVQMPWRANCFAIYGGLNNIIQDSVCEDVLAYPGIMVGNLFNAHPFGSDMPMARSVSRAIPISKSVTSQVKNMTVIRGGGTFFSAEQGALKLNAEQGAVTDIEIANVDVIDALFAGVTFNTGSMKGIKLSNINVTGSGGYGVELDNNPKGTNVVFDSVKVLQSKLGVIFGKGISADNVRAFYTGEIITK